MKFKRAAITFLFGGIFMIAARTVAHAEPFYFIDSDGDGKETISLDGSGSNDPDGALIDWVWKVNSVTVLSGYGPTVDTMTYTYSVGWSTVTLTVRDEVQVSSTTQVRVVLLPQSSNRRPLAKATVPDSVMASTSEIALLSVDASASSDPDNDPIIRYKWTEGTTVYYDSVYATSTLTLNGLGTHTLLLTVYSRDSLNIVQFGTNTFTTEVLPYSQTLAGRKFSRLTGVDFSFDPPSSSFAAITFNPLTQTWFVTENALDQLFEIKADGSLLRTIDITGLRRAGIATTDAEGIAWMHGQTYALALHDGKEMAVVNITTATTSLTRAQATIYDVSSGPGKPKGATYVGAEDAFYWVAKSSPMAVVKAQINKSTGKLDTLWTKTVDNLPVSDLSDVAYFPRLSHNLLLISETSETVMEVDLTGDTAVLKSNFSLSAWPIPQASGITFGPDGNMYIVGKHVSGLPEDDFNVFKPTEIIPNLSPTAKIEEN